MITIQPLSDQFEPETVEKIRELQKRLDQYPIHDGAGILYAKELSLSLEAGLLLSSTHLSSTLLEVFLRDLLLYINLDQSDNYAPSTLKKNDIEEIRLEDSKKPQYSFYKILSEVSNHLDIEKQLYDDIIDFYNNIRIPLSHGLSRRFLRGERVDDPSIIESYDFFEMIAGSRLLRFHNLDRTIEENALGIVDRVISITEKIVSKLES